MTVLCFMTPRRCQSSETTAIDLSGSLGLGLSSSAISCSSDRTTGRGGAFRPAAARHRSCCGNRQH